MAFPPVIKNIITKYGRKKPFVQNKKTILASVRNSSRPAVIASGAKQSSGSWIAAVAAHHRNDGIPARA
jgi:hypothetical protein